MLSFSKTDNTGALLLELPSRAVLRQLDNYPNCLGARAERWFIESEGTADQPYALRLFGPDREEPLLNLVLDTGDHVGIYTAQFSRDGLHLVWGSPDGAVTVVDLVEVQRRLAALGLGW